MKKILITGGSGFIGSNLIEFYLKNGIECLNLDIEPPQNKKHFPFWKDVDILNYTLLEEAILNYQPTHCIHLAARTDIDENKYIKNYAVNFGGTENLIKALNKCDILERVIFTSSMLVCEVAYDPKYYDDYKAPNLYGESKILMEKVIKGSDIYKYEWIIIRPTSIWGPWFRAPYKDFFDLVINGKYVKFSGKSSTKTFGFVFNSVYQIDKLLFLDKLLVNKKTFYIGDNPPININEWADEISRQLNKKIISIPFSFIKTLSLFGDVLKFCGIKFPIYSFRLKNMTTDNVITLLNDTVEIIPKKLFTMQEGVTETLKWINEQSDLK